MKGDDGNSDDDNQAGPTQDLTVVPSSPPQSSPDKQPKIQADLPLAPSDRTLDDLLSEVSQSQ